MLHVWPFRYDWQQDYPDTLVENLRSRGRLEAKRGHDASHDYSVFKAWWWYGADLGRRCSRGMGGANVLLVRGLKHAFCMGLYV